MSSVPTLDRAEVQGTCDQRKGDYPDPLKRICNKPAMLRYAAMHGGYMLLCEEHGRPHVRYCERWDGEKWVRP